MKKLMSQQSTYKQLYESVLASMPASVLLVDRRLCITSANRNFLEKARRSEGATLGQPLAEVFPLVLLSYTRLVERVRNVFVLGQAADGGEMTYRAPGLAPRVYFYRLTPIYEEGTIQVQYVMLLMEDVTERVQLGAEVRRAERHLASVVESANDIVVSMDTNGIINTWNFTAETLSGFSRSEIHGCSLVSLCALDDQDAMEALLQKVHTSKGRSGSVEINLITKAEKRIPIAWSIAAMRDDVGKVIGLVAIGHDLTERRQMETQLILSAKMASLGVMAGGIAHEIRNPLGICLTTAQLLQESANDPVLLHEATKKICVAVRRASDIIENLLKFVRPSSQGRMVTLGINEILEDTLTLMTNETNLRLIRVETQFSTALSAVIGNRNLLQQVFTNLVLNAARAMPNGGQLCVKTGVSDGQVQVIFTDTGVGIAPAHLDRIFDPFFTTMPVGQGIGLGLSISYAIIQQHGGRITVKSQIGEGSTFIVWLPMAGSAYVQ